MLLQSRDFQGSCVVDYSRPFARLEYNGRGAYHSHLERLDAELGQLCRPEWFALANEVRPRYLLLFVLPPFLIQKIIVDNGEPDSHRIALALGVDVHSGQFARCLQVIDLQRLAANQRRAAPGKSDARPGLIGLNYF